MIYGVDCQVDVSSPDCHSATDNWLGDNELQIMSGFKALLHLKASMASECSSEQMILKIAKFNDLLSRFGQDMQLVHVQKQSSVGAYFQCASIEAFEKLELLYRSGDLSSILESIFQLSLNGSSVVIRQLRWNAEQYALMKNYLSRK